MKFEVFDSSDSDFYEATISGTSVSLRGTETSDAPGGELSVIYETNADVPVFAYEKETVEMPIAFLILAIGLTSENFIGFAEEDVTAMAWRPFS